MEVLQLKEIAEQFLSNHYGMSLSIPLKRNNRLRSTLGRYVFTHNDEPLQIELAGFMLDYGAKSSIIDVLKHECIHYALHVQNRPHEDGHPYFEAELRKHGVSSTQKKNIGKYYVFQCQSCGKEGKSRRKRVVTHPINYRTPCCHASLRVIGEKIYDGT